MIKPTGWKNDLLERRDFATRGGASATKRGRKRLFRAGVQARAGRTRGVASACETPAGLAAQTSCTSSRGSCALPCGASPGVGAQELPQVLVMFSFASRRCTTRLQKTRMRNVLSVVTGMSGSLRAQQHRVALKGNPSTYANTPQKWF